MAPTLPASVNSLTSYPRELIDAVVVQAKRQADLAADFLHAAGFQATPENPVRLSAGFLQEIGAAMLLLQWEARGLQIHIEAGLPPAKEVIINAFLSTAEHGSIPTGDELPRRVLSLFIERIAWHSWRDWGADLALGDLDEETALDALAELLWNSRHLECDEKG
jgi:hypothetical protein